MCSQTYKFWPGAGFCMRRGTFVQGMGFSMGVVRILIRCICKFRSQLLSIARHVASSPLFVYDHRIIWFWQIDSLHTRSNGFNDFIEAILDADRTKCGLKRIKTIVIGVIAYINGEYALINWFFVLKRLFIFKFVNSFIFVWYEMRLSSTRSTELLVFLNSFSSWSYFSLPNNSLAGCSGSSTIQWYTARGRVVIKVGTKKNRLE